MPILKTFGRITGFNTRQDLEAVWQIIWNLQAGIPIKLYVQRLK